MMAVLVVVLVALALVVIVWVVIVVVFKTVAVYQSVSYTHLTLPTILLV